MIFRYSFLFYSIHFVILREKYSFSYFFWLVLLFTYLFSQGWTESLHSNLNRRTFVMQSLWHGLNNGKGRCHHQSQYSWSVDVNQFDSILSNLSKCPLCLLCHWLNTPLHYSSNPLRQFALSHFRSFDVFFFPFCEFITFLFTFLLSFFITNILNINKSNIFSVLEIKILFHYNFLSCFIVYLVKRRKNYKKSENKKRKTLQKLEKKGFKNFFEYTIFFFIKLTRKVQKKWKINKLLN